MKECFKADEMILKDPAWSSYNSGDGLARRFFKFPLIIEKEVAELLVKCR